MADKTIICKVCEASFVFTANEQAFYKEKGLLNEPQKCSECRGARRSQSRNNDGYRQEREMFPATCSDCGQSTMVPFKPNLDKPVYCKECFRPNNR